MLDIMFRNAGVEFALTPEWTPFMDSTAPTPWRSLSFIVEAETAVIAAWSSKFHFIKFLHFPRLLYSSNYSPSRFIEAFCYLIKGAISSMLSQSVGFDF